MVVVNTNEHSNQNDVIFVIEGTAVNGAYFNDLKTNYLIPTLEHFNQGAIEDREYVTENSTTRYGIVIYHAADCLPRPCVDTFGPFSNPHKLLLRLENLEMVGGRGESHASIAEGLATALVCFEDLQAERDPNTKTQKHCILVCNSPPYQIAVRETEKYVGYTIETLPTLFQKRSIFLSIVSPRKIPEFFKLFELSGGDLQTSQTKNYTKDPRNLVLLHNYNLKERPVSPTQIGGAVHSTSTSAAQIPLSPLQSHDSPNTNQNTQSIPQPQTQNPAFRNQNPMNIQVNHQTVTPSMSVPMNPGRPVFNAQLSGPPNYHPGARAQPQRWRTPFIPGSNVQSNNQGSALLAQLAQPPSLGLNVAFNQRMDNNGMAANTQQPQQQQQPQLTQQQQQQLRNMQLQQQQQQQQQQQLQQQQQQQQQQVTIQAMQAQQPPQNQNVPPQLTVSSVSQTVSTPVQQTVTVSQPTVAAPSVPQQVAHNLPQGTVAQAAVPGQQMVQTSRERSTIWQGILEWLEKAKNPSDTPKQTRQVPCHVSANTKDGEPELKTDSWPQKLLMQLMPKQLIGSIGGIYLKNSKSVIFHPTPCEALDSLTKVMSTGFAGCVHFTSGSSTAACDIKVLILLYTVEKRAYLGFIPNDQVAFVDRLRKVIQHQKSTHALMRQGQATGGPPNSIPGSIPTSGISQGNMLMSQSNSMSIGSGQMASNVVSSNNQQQSLNNTVAQGQINMQTGVMQSQQVNTATGGMIGQQRPQFPDDLEMARHQNLMKIHQLRQTLEAAQQQEAQYKSQQEAAYKSQLEVNIQQNLDVAQQQELQYKQQIEAQQAQRALNPNTGIAGQQPNAQRMMRPVMANSSGLRHLLQQQQYRPQQVLTGIQQQMVGQRGQMPTRPTNTGNPSNQQFDDVSNYDFLG